MSAVMSPVREPTAAELEVETTVQRATGSEILTVAGAFLLLMVVEALGSKPRILFERYFSVDEMWAKFLESDPSIWHSLVTLKHSPDQTPPLYHLVVRAFWRLWGGSPETAFRVPSFITIWIALVLTYTVLRRSFAILPSLVAVLALWSYGPIVMYAFFARPYALLLASTAGFCLIYGDERTDGSRAVVTAGAAALVCSSHYFVIFGLASIVFVDVITRPATPSQKLKRLLPVTAGPIALLLILPFIRATTSGYPVASYLPPLTLSFAFQQIVGGPVVGFFGSAITFALVLEFAWRASELVRRCSYEKNPPAEPLHLSQPTILLSALLLVPLVLVLFSVVTDNYLLDRYMITGLLGTTPLMAMIASRSSKRVLVYVSAFFTLVGAVRVHGFGLQQEYWQMDRERLIRQVNTLNDRVPIVAYSKNEAYLIYSYAPLVRPRLFIADFSSSHMRDLSRGILVDGEIASRWSAADPALPKLVNLSELRQIGEFHLVDASDVWVLAHPIGLSSDEREAYTAKVLSLRRLAKTKTGEIDSLYEAEGN
jgi:hypothetical protein